MTREEAIRRMECCRNFLANNYSDMGEPNVTAFNMAIKALEQEPTKEEQALLQKWRDNRGISIEEFEDAMNTLQEPCEDCISRKDTLAPYKELKDDDVISVWLIKKNIEQQLSVAPKPRKGHWKYIGNGHNGLFECDNCGAHRNMFNELEKYCYACGAKMESEE